jgi:hypothetical protein
VQVDFQKLATDWALLETVQDYENLITRWDFLCLRVKQRGSAGSAQACYKAGPSWNLGSAPHGGSADGCEDTDMGPANVYEWMNDAWTYLLYKIKIIKLMPKSGKQPLNL